jgi:hypothetical protein
MPKTIIDYSNTIIYKIRCKDASITDVYVGHTTNFVQRKHAHKQSCSNEKSLNYNCKLYKTIRLNGGWDNWLMEIVAFYKCYDHYEARMKEQEYFTLLNATLNSIEPLPKPKPKELPLQKNVPLYCFTCNLDFDNSEEISLHKHTEKHSKNMKTETNKNNIKTAAKIFSCILCNYSTSKKSSFDKHLLTSKHAKLTISNDLSFKDDIKKYNCEICNKIYDSRNGLWKHNKICKYKNTCETVGEENKITENQNNEIQEIKEFMKCLTKDNSEIKIMMMEVIKNISKQVLVEKEQPFESI